MIMGERVDPKKSWKLATPNQLIVMLGLARGHDLGRWARGNLTSAECLLLPISALTGTKTKRYDIFCFWQYNHVYCMYTYIRVWLASESMSWSNEQGDSQVLQKSVQPEMVEDSKTYSAPHFRMTQVFFCSRKLCCVGGATRLSVDTMTTNMTLRAQKESYLKIQIHIPLCISTLLVISRVKQHNQHFILLFLFARLQHIRPEKSWIDSARRPAVFKYSSCAMEVGSVSLRRVWSLYGHC